MRAMNPPPWARTGWPPPWCPYASATSNPYQPANSHKAETTTMYHRRYNPAGFAPSTAMPKPSCPPGYTITNVKQSGGHVFSYECASTSASPGPFSCPPGYKVTQIAKGRFACTRITGQIQRASNPRCPPGYFYSQDLGCVAHGTSVQAKPKCGPGMTWTEDLGCVKIPRSGSGRSRQCPPGWVYSEDIGCFQPRRGNPGYGMRSGNKTCTPPCKSGSACNYSTGKCEARDIKLPPPGGDPLPNRAGRTRSMTNPKDLLAMCCAQQDANGKCTKWVQCSPQARRADTIRRVRERVRQATNPGCGCGSKPAANPCGCGGACGGQAPNPAKKACCASCAAGGPCGG